MIKELREIDLKEIEEMKKLNTKLNLLLFETEMNKTYKDQIRVNEESGMIILNKKNINLSLSLLDMNNEEIKEFQTFLKKILELKITINKNIKVIEEMAEERIPF